MLLLHFEVQIQIVVFETFRQIHLLWTQPLTLESYFQILAVKNHLEIHIVLKSDLGTIFKSFCTALNQPTSILKRNVLQSLLLFNIHTFLRLVLEVRGQQSDGKCAVLKHFELDAIGLSVLERFVGTYVLVFLSLWDFPNYSISYL